MEGESSPEPNQITSDSKVYLTPIDSEEICFICGTISKNISNNYNFEECCHLYCVSCLFREIFKNNLKEIIDQNEIKVKCKCKKGNKNLYLKDIDEIIKFKSKLDEQEKENNNIFCSIHTTDCDLFCKDCEKYICYHCKNEPEHSKHNTILISKYARMYKEFIRGMPLKFKYAENFKLHLDKSVDKFSRDLAEKTYRAINEINYIIEELNLIKNDYLTKLKEIQDNGLEPINLMKSFYFEYYSDLLNFENSNDIFSLRYLAQIKSEINDFEMEYSLGIFNKLEEIQTKIKEFKSVTENPFSIKVNYIDIPTTFREVIRILGHEREISCLAKIGDNQIISGSLDNTIKFWNLDDEELKPYEVLDKCIGKVGFLLLLDNNKICSASTEHQENSIKIYKKTQIFCENKENGKMEPKYEYILETTLSGHKMPLTSIIELDNCLLVSAARDGLIIIWQTIQSIIKNYDSIKVCNDGVYSLCKLKDNKFASGDADGKIKLWKENAINNKDEINNKYYCYLILNDGSQKTKIRSLILVNNNYLCSGDDDGNINVFNIIDEERYETIWSKNLENETITYLTYIKQGYLISASYNIKSQNKIFLRVWVPNNNNNGYERKETITKHNKPIRSVIELDWGNIASAGDEGVIIIWKSGILFE